MDEWFWPGLERIPEHDSQYPEAEAGDRGGGHALASDLRNLLAPIGSEFATMVSGGMAERSKAAVLKTVRVERLSGVRIPLPPPHVTLSKAIIFRGEMSRCSGNERLVATAIGSARGSWFCRLLVQAALGSQANPVRYANRSDAHSRSCQPRGHVRFPFRNFDYEQKVGPFVAAGPFPSCQSVRPRPVRVSVGPKARWLRRRTHSARVKGRGQGNQAGLALPLRSPA
jgi:hypothetical protein